MYKIWNWLTPVIVISDYDIAKEFYKNHLKHTRDSDFSLGPIVKAMLGNAIGTKYGTEWTHHRRCLKFMLMPKFIEHWKPIISIMCADYVNDILDSGNIDISKTMSRFTVNIISRIMYGKLNVKQSKKLMQISDLHEELMSLINSTPFHAYIPSSTTLLINKFKYKWKKFNIKIAGQATDPNTGMFYMRESGLNQKEMLDNLDEIILFNIDVMYSSLGALIVNLARYPEYQKIIYKQIA